MSKPSLYLEVEVPKKLNLENLEVLRKRVYEGEIRPSLRGADIGDEYHLCLYVGQANLQNSGGNYLLPSTGILQLTRKDGSILPDDEWYYVRVLEKQFAELDATYPIVVVQSVAIPELPGRFSSAWEPEGTAPLPGTPPSRAVEFETFDGSPLSAAFIGELTEEVAGVPVRVDRILISCDLKLMFTPDEVRRYELELANIDGPVAVAGPVSELNDLEPLNEREPATWFLRKPDYFRGYTEPLYAFLKAAHDAGQPCPSAADVLRVWKDSPPFSYGIKISHNLKTMTYHGKGESAEITIYAKAVTQVIRRLTTPKEAEKEPEKETNNGPK